MRSGSKISAVAIAAVLLLSGCVGQYFENVGKAFKGHFMDYEYDSVPERWRNEWVSDSRAASEVIKALLSSADSGDREAFSENFTPEMQAKGYTRLDSAENAETFLDVKLISSFGRTKVFKLRYEAFCG